MLRIGKSPKESADNETSPEKPDVSPYSTPRTFSSYQPATPEVKPQVEYAPAALKALTGKDFGPGADASLAERAQAITKWKDWWSSNGEK